MIVHIFTIKICGMVNETILSTYEIVNLRTILIFVGKNYFSETKGGYLKCLRGFRGGVSQMSMFVYKGERGVKNALNSVYVVCTQSLAERDSKWGHSLQKIPSTKMNHYCFGMQSKGFEK